MRISELRNKRVSRQTSQVLLVCPLVRIGNPQNLFRFTHLARFRKTDFVSLTSCFYVLELRLGLEIGLGLGVKVRVRVRVNKYNISLLRSYVKT